MSSTGENSARPQKKLRSACDSCHQIKVRCTGGSPCQTCQNLAMECVYSVSSRIGRPRGTKNKKTLRRLSFDENSIGDVEAKSDGSASTSAASLKNPTEIGAAVTSDGPAASRWHQDESMTSPFAANLSHEIDAMSRLTLPPSGTQGIEPDDAALWNMTFDGACNPVSMTSPSPGMLPPASSTPFDASMDFLAMKEIRKEMASFSSTPTTSTISSDGSAWHLNSPHHFERALGQYPTGSNSGITPNGHESTDAEATDLAEIYRNDPSLTCSCLRRHAELLCRFKEIQASTQPRIDVLLVTAKEGIETWKAFLQCTHCQDGDDQVARLLSTMCLRTLIQATRGLGLKSGATSGSVPPSRKRDLRYDDKPKQRVHDPGYALNLAPGPERVGTQPTRTSMGMYEITGPDQTMVTTVLLCQMLTQVKTVLGDFKRRVEAGLWDDHRRRGPASREANSFDSEAKRRKVVVDDAAPNEKRQGYSDEDEPDADYHHDAMHLLGLLKGLENEVKVLRNRLQDPSISPSRAG